MIDTTKAQRRTVEYPTLDDVMADARRLVEAGAETSGNWSLGQILEHLATVMDKSIDGFDMKPSWFMALMGRLILKRIFLKNGFPAGFQLKGAAAKELVAEDTTDTQQALEHLCRAAERLKNETHRPDHPFFGKVDQAESNRINCRHAELHMSFVQEP